MCRARATAGRGEIGPEVQIMFHFLVLLPLPTTGDATPLRLTASKRDVVRLQPHLMPSNPIDDLGGDRQAGPVAGQWPVAVGLAIFTSQSLWWGSENASWMLGEAHVSTRSGIKNWLEQCSAMKRHWE